MNFFEEAALRLKQQLKATEDKQVAEALGMTGSAWTQRKKRNSFPEKELYALVAKRPDLGLDVDYVLTGITAASRGLNDAARGRVERASEAGLEFEDLRAFAKAQGRGPGSARMAQLQTMLPKLRATEFEGVFELVQSIVGLREALEDAVHAGNKQLVQDDVAQLSAGMSVTTKGKATPVNKVKVSSTHGHAAGRDVHVNQGGPVDGGQKNSKPGRTRSGA